MLLKKITLNDFGLYGGHNEFDLTTSIDKSIILFGGKNGAGKTTFFESIMLCLYGQKSFAKRITQKQYLGKMAKAFHRYLGIKKSAEETSIVVEFQYSHEGEITEYQIARMWQNNDGKIDETLTIKKKTPQESTFTNLDSIEESEWQVFIDQLLPKGVANLFFFDGEKIQAIADSGNESEHIRSSFDTLLGLDLVKQLHDDVGLYLLRDSDGESKKILDAIDQKNREKQEAYKKIEDYQEKQAYMKSDISTFQRKLEILEANFSKLGGGFAQRREELTIKKVNLESNLEQVEKQIREFCGNLLPFATIPKQLELLKEELKSDQIKIQNSFEFDILESNFKELLNKIKTIPDNNSFKDIKKIFEQQLDDISDIDKTTFNFSTSDMNRFISLIDQINKSSFTQIQSLTKSHIAILKSLKNTKAALDVSPKTDEIGPLFSQIQEVNREIGMLQNELSSLEDLESQEKSMVVLLNSNIRQNLAKRKIDNRRLAGLDLGPKIQDVLDEYSKLLRDKKIQLLENYILDGIKKIFHKKDFIDKISIDKESFEVTLYKKNDDEISKDILSKGELQMYATAIVWGLAKTSGRPIPFMIDTPLARLDMDHRDNLIDDFYPFASHQTIILSTNSEITYPYYKRLEPYISKSMVIQYDSEKGKTNTCEGYFFDKNGVELVEAK